MSLKKAFSGFVGYFFLVFLALLLVFVSIKGSFSLPSTELFADKKLDNIFVIFVAVLVWFISPMGVLSFVFGGWRSGGSILKHKFSGLSEFLAATSWFSFMIVLMLVYVDDIYIGVLNLGSNILYLAIVSGFVFGLLMILKIFWRKLNVKESVSSSDFIEGELGDKNCGFGCCERAVETEAKFTGIKSRIKNKVKEDLKEIFNEEIDKRF